MRWVGDAATQWARRVLFVPGIANAAVEYLLRLGAEPGNETGRLHVRTVPGGAVGAGGRRARIPFQAGRQPTELRPPGLGRRRAFRPGAAPPPRRAALARRTAGVSGDLRSHCGAGARSRSPTV